MNDLNIKLSDLFRFWRFSYNSLEFQRKSLTTNCNILYVTILNTIIDLH